MNHIWIIEVKIKRLGQNPKWHTVISFPNVQSIHKTRKWARKAAKQMFRRNIYNYCGNQFKPYVFYKAVKYSSTN